MKTRVSLKYFVSYCSLGAQTCTPASESLWIRHCNIPSSRSSHQTCSMIKGVARGDEGDNSIPPAGIPPGWPFHPRGWQWLMLFCISSLLIWAPSLGAQTCFSASKSLWIRHCNILSFRSSHQTCSMINDVLRNFAKFGGKRLCQSLFFNKVAGLRFATLIKKRLWHRCFPVNFA